MRPLQTSTEPSFVPHQDGDLRARVAAEFQEMPGLRLTLPQAMRLFHHDRLQCERVLGALVARGELARHGEAFARIHADARVAPHLW